MTAQWLAFAPLLLRIAVCFSAGWIFGWYFTTKANALTIAERARLKELEWRSARSTLVRPREQALALARQLVALADSGGDLQTLREIAINTGDTYCLGYIDRAAEQRAGEPITPEMLRECDAHMPLDLKQPIERWHWKAEYLNRALAAPNAPCPCCNVTPAGEIRDDLPAPKHEGDTDGT